MGADWYAAEISGAIIRTVGGIGGEVTTEYVLRYRAAQAYLPARSATPLCGTLALCL